MEVPIHGDFFSRLQQEQTELMMKAQKLDAFIDTPPFFQLDGEEQRDLTHQLEIMVSYLGILSKRVNRILKKH